MEGEGVGNTGQSKISNDLLMRERFLLAGEAGGRTETGRVRSRLGRLAIEKERERQMPEDEKSAWKS